MTISQRFPSLRPAPNRIAGLPAILLSLAALPAGAASYTLSTPDAIGESSFASAGNWSSGLAPSEGHHYFVDVEQLRTPADGESHVFGGSRLIVRTGGLLMYKGVGTTGVITVDDLMLSGGTIDHRNGSVDLFVLAGGLDIGSDSTVDARQGEIRIESQVTGDGVLNVVSSGGNGYPVTLAGSVELESNLEVGSPLVLDEVGTYHFNLPTTGLANSITGTGSVALNGTLVLDLEGSTLIGRLWTLVDAETLALTHGENFAIDGFTENDGYWTDPAREYRYSEATGVVTRITGDSDGDGFPDSWEQENFGNLEQSASGDFDLDGSSNRFEYEEGTDPADAGDFPDSDGDGMSDGWELTYFGSLDALPDEDSDNDFNSNLDEFLAGTDPTDGASYPDLDDGGTGDGINDGWEVNYFGSIEACEPDEDVDGDFYTNLEEFEAGTDPQEQVSSPDSDSDGLADGWEVLHFGSEGEDLATIIEKFDGNDDPDLDRYTNRVESTAGTDPNDAGSAPSALAYWRFEERTEGLVPTDETGGNVQNTVLDSSGSENHLMTWLDYTSPIYGTDLPFETVPATGETNTASLSFTADRGNLFVTDNIYTSPGTSLPSYLFEEFTVEATFKPSAVADLFQVVVGKSGNPVGGQPPFSLKIDPAGNLRAGIVDGSGVARELIGTSVLVPDSWYSAAVTASATQLRLWLKGPDDSSYQLEGSLAIRGPFHDYEGLDAAWVVGLGKWNGEDADPFGGVIDEVRIMPFETSSNEFLASDGTVDADSDGDGMPDDWELANFGNLDQKAEDDFDGDSTSNLAEFLLGLDPTDPGSRFAATTGGEGEIEWPSASGIEFTVERSETLGDDWEAVGTVPGVDGLQSWTDPEAPETRAFYRVSFPE